MKCSCFYPTEVEPWAEFILREVSIPVVGSVGLVGNLAAIVVLSQPDMKSTFHQSLITLAVFEILYLLLVIYEQGAIIWSELYIMMFLRFLAPVKNTLLTCETFLLMSIALERLIAVVRPLWYRNARLRLSSCYHALVFILPTLVISVSFNIPRFFELQLVSEGGKLAFELAPFRLDPDYIEYNFWSRFLGTGLLPILFLLVTNISIYLSLRRQRPTNKSPRVFSILSNWMGNGNENSGINIMLTEDQITENRRCLSNSARTLSVIVIMYIVCNIPRLLLNLTEYLYRFQLYQNFSQCGCTNKVWLEVTLWLSRFLLTVNSSVNFIIYWSVGKKFKSTLREIFTKIRCSFSITPNNENVEFI